MRLERAGSFVEPRLPNFPPRHHHVLAASQQSGCELHILSISEYNKLSIPLLEIFYTLVTLQLPWRATKHLRQCSKMALLPQQQQPTAWPRSMHTSRQIRQSGAAVRVQLQIFLPTTRIS